MSERRVRSGSRCFPWRTRIGLPKAGLAGFEGAHHMFFHGTLGQAHGLGDLGVFAAVNAIEQEDLPRALRQGAQRGFDVAQIVARLQCRLRSAAIAVRWFHHQAFAGPAPRAFTAQMVDGDVAGTAQQVGAEFLDLHQRPLPETQEQILYQVSRRRPATDTPTHQCFHLRTLGEKHLEKMRTVATLLIVLDIVGVGGQSDHRSCFDLKTGEATTASGGRQGRDNNDKYSHMQKDRM
ncbi:hypothetical protein EMIT0P258_20487 [Pseudomonas sp. IT-P258]